MRANIAPLHAEPMTTEIDLAGGKPVRLTLPGGGRAHVDRALPFLILNRAGARDSLATAVATTSPAYVLWPAGGGREAVRTAGGIARAFRACIKRVLLISLYDLPRDTALDDDDPKLEAFTARVSASDDPAAQAAAACLGEALGKLEVDLRTCHVESVSKAWFEPGVEALVESEDWLSHISLGLPQNYRIPGEAGVYPQLRHELGIGVFDALLRGARAFMARIGEPPKSHRALGRRSFIDAARSVDRKLFRVSTSFDFLLGVSPINSEQAWAQFKADKHDKMPGFRYRPLTVDADQAKRALYAIDLRRVEDPILETLFAEKRRELDLQLGMLAGRNTADFRYASMMLYGAVEPSLLARGRDILARVEGGRGEAGESIGAAEVEKGARALVTRYRKADPRFAARIRVRDDIPAGLMVSGHTLMIASGTHMPRHRLDALLQHEISIHLLTCVNGDAQGLKIFRTGLAGYEGVQEGLGVFAECAVGGLTRARLRLLAARVVAVDAMIGGASFVEAWRVLRDDHGLGARMAFNIVARVYRSGGLTKDAIYLRGFQEVLDLLAAGRDLTPYWFGKIATRHIPVVEELAARGLLSAPSSTPEFLARPDARDRIEAMRAITSPVELL